MSKDRQCCRLAAGPSAKMPNTEESTGTQSSAGDRNRSPWRMALPKILSFLPLEKLKAQKVSEPEDRQCPGGGKPHYILGMAHGPATKEETLPVGV